MGKRILITTATIVGMFMIAEWLMPGHWERFSVYMEGNGNAFMSIIQ